MEESAFFVTFQIHLNSCMEALVRKSTCEITSLVRSSFSRFHSKMESREAENMRLWARPQVLDARVEQTGVNGPRAGGALEEGACLLHFHTHLSSCMDSIVRETAMEITTWVKGNVGRILGDVASGGDKTDSRRSSGDNGSPAQGFEDLEPGYADPGQTQEKTAVATRQAPEAACFVVDYELTVATTAMEEHPLGEAREEKEEEGVTLRNPHLHSYTGTWVAEEGEASSVSPEESSLAAAEPLGPVLEMASGQVETALHICSHCGRSFSKEWVLRRHMRRHSEDGALETGAASHTCPHCNRNFKHRKGLVSHLHSHSGTKAYSCDVCEQRFTRPESLNKHRRLHSGVKPYSCSLCCRRFFRSDGLKSHMQTHEGTRKPPSRAPAKLCMCAHCGKAFSSVTQVANHERTHTGEKPYECPLCHKRFRHAGALSVHRITHQRERPHVCPRCPKSFRCSKHLKRHLVTHSDARPFTCDQCLLAFRTANELKGHKIRHSLQRTHGCPDCGKNFKTEYEVKLHRRAHNGERPYSCPECQRTFRRLHHLTSHRLTHTGEKPFACDVCQRRFIRAREMRNHKKKVHLATEPSKCDHCQMDFENLPLLEAHKRCCHSQVQNQNQEIPGLSKFPKILPRHVVTDRLQESTRNQCAQPGKMISVEQPGGKGPVLLVLAAQGVSLPVLQPSPVLTPGTTLLKLPLAAAPLSQVTTPLKVQIPPAARAPACRAAVRASLETKESSSGHSSRTDPPGKALAGRPATTGAKANMRSKAKTKVSDEPGSPDETAADGPTRKMGKVTRRSSDKPAKIM